MMFAEIDSIFQKLIKISLYELHDQADLAQVHLGSLGVDHAWNRIAGQALAGGHASVAWGCYDIDQLRYKRMSARSKVFVADMIKSSHYLYLS